VIHGETDSALAFSRYLQEKLNWKTHVPEYRETVPLT
jgi:predicted metal-dependent RNase